MPLPVVCWSAEGCAVRAWNNARDIPRTSPSSRVRMRAGNLMQSQDPIALEWVLAGSGHSHLEVLKLFAPRRPLGLRLTLVSDTAEALYTGMVPGLIAGEYRRDQVGVDLHPLCQKLGVRLLVDRIQRLDADARRLQLQRFGVLGYDLLSLNVGSRPPLGDHWGVPVKPAIGLVRALDALLARPQGGRLAVIGGGVGGVELALALAQRLAGHPLRWELLLVAERLAPSVGRWARRRLLEALRCAGVEVVSGLAAHAQPGEIALASGEVLAVDQCFWATGAAPLPWLAHTGLALDERGFVQADRSLRSVSHPDVLASGDTAAPEGLGGLQRSGVLAVRQGQALARILDALARQRPVPRWHPQRNWLSLLGISEHRALAVRWPLAASGRWALALKRWIDRRYMRMFERVGSMSIERLPLDTVDYRELSQMRCGGCAAKIPATALAKALRALGVDVADDAALVSIPTGQELLQSVDFFRLPLDDPWRGGRIAALHALGDLHACGARPLSALALLQLPPGTGRALDNDLRLLLGGAQSALQQEGVKLLGGHSAEGAESGIGFSVNGAVEPGQMLRKGGAQVGDALLLSRPLGTGLMLAANAVGALPGAWLEALLEALCESHGAAVKELARTASAGTDVTGFGLAGHALEMASAAGLGMRIELDALPAWDGALEMAAAGWRSSLHGSNDRFGVEIVDPDHPRAALVF